MSVRRDLLGAILALVALEAASGVAFAQTTGALSGIYRNASNDNYWDNGGNIVCEGNVTAPINFTWGGSACIGACCTTVDQFQVEYIGEVLTTGSGTYSFCLDSDDGGFIQVNNTTVLDDKSTHGLGTQRCGTIILSASTWYPVKLGMFEGGGGAGIKFYWTPPASGNALVPAANLRTFQSDGYLKANVTYHKVSGATLSDGCWDGCCFGGERPDVMWGIYIGDNGALVNSGRYNFCDSECDHSPNQKCNDCNVATWDPTDFTLRRIMLNKTKAEVIIDHYDDDGALNAADHMGGDFLDDVSASNPGDWMVSGRANNYVYGPMSDICPDNDGTVGPGGCSTAWTSYWKIEYSDPTAPPVPSAPSVADANAPNARAGYDNDLTATIAWTETDDAHSGTADYNVILEESTSGAFAGEQTTVVNSWFTDLDACGATANARTTTYTGVSGRYYRARVASRNGGCVALATQVTSAWSAYSSIVRVDVRHPVAVDAVPAGGFAPYTTYTTGVLRCYARNRASGNENEQNMDGAIVGECNIAAPVSYDYGVGAITCGLASAVDYFNVDCWGEVLAGSTGVYTFGLNTDDGGYVMVNNTMVVRDQTYHGWNGASGAYTASGTISLTAGTWYPIRAGFFEAGGGASWELKWTPPAGALANIPASSLRRVNDHWARSADTISFDLISHDVHSGPLMQNIVLAKSNAPTCGGWSWHDWSSTAANATNEGTCGTYITFPLSGSEIKEASESGGTTFVFRFTPDFLAASNGGDFDISTRNMDLAGDWSGDCTNTPSNDTCDVDTGRNLRIDDDAPTFGAVTPANTATATHVDATFDLSTTFADPRSGVASCQRCLSIDGVCDAEWTAATWSAGACSVTGLTCSDGQSLTLNMRATDNVGNVGTASGASRTCDTVAPTTTDNGSSAWTGADVIVTLTPADARSGVASTAYCVDTTNTCTPGTSGTSVSVTCAAGTVCQQYVRYRSTDNVGNVQAIQTAAAGATIKIDKQGPPTVPGSLAVMLTGNKTLKATWTAASDGTGSGLAATPYAVQVGLTGADASGCAAVSSTASLNASPSQYRTAPAACTLTSMADNTQYCFIIRASDAVTPANTSDSATVCATAVIANETVSGVVKGYAASATNQGANYIGTYAGSGNVVYLLDGSAGLVTSLTLGAGETISGAPFWSYEGASNYAYVGTNDGSSIGRIYKIQNTDGAPANDPAGNTLATVSGWPITLPDKCGGAGTARQVTTSLVPDDKLVYFGMVDSGCAVGNRNYILAYEITPTSYDADAGGDGISDKIVDVTACSSSGSMMSAPTVKPSPINWASARYLHIGSDCPTGELYRVRVDTGAVPIGTVDCQRDVAGEIQAWITGSFGKLFFGTLGGAAARFYVLQNTESGAACPTTAYSDLSGFPYTPAGSADIPSGAKVNWTGLSDEAYFVDNSGRIYCVCQNTGTGCASVGASCTGFPVLLESGVALREPLYHDGTLYIVSNTGRIYAIESLYDPSCTANNCDATGSGTIKSTNGFTYRLDTSGVESTLAVRCTSTTSPCPSASTRLTIGTDTGRIFYLPVTP